MSYQALENCDGPAAGRSRAASAAAVLAALRSGDPLPWRVTVVVAHPDDETIGLGARLPAMPRLTLAHVTDGAVRGAAGNARGQAEIREAELAAALRQLGIAPRRVALRLGDQAAVFSLGHLVGELEGLLAAAEVVVTHAYEGGHPDHDSAAFAVQLACRRLRLRRGAAPVRLEFAGYHLCAGRRVTGRFPGAGGRAVAPALSGAALERKRRALACFSSQADVVAWFDPAQEAYRRAPVYDFRAPPPPGAALYDGFGWPVTSQLWRRRARQALLDLQAGAA